MAKAYQCDRCMQYYTANKENSVPGMGTDKIVSGFRYTYDQGERTASKDVELCDDCAKKLIDFVLFREVKQ